MRCKLEYTEKIALELCPWIRWRKVSCEMMVTVFGMIEVGDWVVWSGGLAALSGIGRRSDCGSC